MVWCGRQNLNPVNREFFNFPPISQHTFVPVQNCSCAQHVLLVADDPNCLRIFAV